MFLLYIRSTNKKSPQGMQSTRVDYNVNDIYLYIYTRLLPLLSLRVGARVGFVFSQTRINTHTFNVFDRRFECCLQSSMSSQHAGGIYLDHQSITFWSWHDVEGNLKKVAQSDVWDIYKIPNAMTRASQTKKNQGCQERKTLVADGWIWWRTNTK